MAEKTDILEKFEWDSPWWEHMEDAVTPRILYIGDSISVGTRTALNKAMGGALYFDSFSTSKGLDNSWMQPSILQFTSQQHRLDGILFNNGLHGWHLDDSTEYVSFYEKMIVFLREQFPDVPLWLLLTTVSTIPDTDARVRERNAGVCRLAEKYGLPVIDLYRVADTHRDLLVDSVHFNPEGYAFLAEEILQNLPKF